MKTLRNLFANTESKKSLNKFSNSLDFEAMQMIKGGEVEEGDIWPPDNTNEKK